MHFFRRPKTLKIQDIHKDKVLEMYKIDISGDMTTSRLTLKDCQSPGHVTSHIRTRFKQQDK